jgi:hypothetical protein
MLSSLSRRLFMAVCAAPAIVARASDSTAVKLLTTPGGGLQPQSAVDRSGVIHLVYLYGDPSAADVAYVRKAPGDKDFSTPVRVNDRPGSAIALGTVRGVHLALGRANRVHVAWNGSSTAEPKGTGKSSPMLYTRLKEDGTGFEPQRNLMLTGSGLDGGGTVAADSAGNVYVTWHAQGQADGHALEGEAHRRVWMARSADDGQNFSPETPISPAELGACGCCGMGALADSRGNLYLLYRSAREVVHREIYLLVSTDKGKTFRATCVHPWEIGACPMSTASLTEAAGRVLISWETAGQVFFAPINTETLQVGKPVQAPGSGAKRKHPSIAGNSRGETLLTWTEGTGWKKGGSLSWQVFDAANRPISGKSEARMLPAWDFASSVNAAGTFLVISSTA